MHLNSLFISESLSLQISAKESINFSAVQTDSRKTFPKSLFVALKGENFDGHDFIEKAVEKGALGILCRKDFQVKLPSHVQIFKVEDTLVGFRNIAKSWRNQFQIPIIAVGGSFGKTTTKELLWAILQGKWKSVLKTQGSQNGFIGIPMTLLELRPEHEAAVIEIGIDEIGAIQKHLDLVQPTAALLTGIGPEHLEKLNNLETVAKEEGYLLSKTAKRGGSIAINGDDPWIKRFQNFQTKNKIYYTMNKEKFLSSTKWDSEVLVGSYLPEEASLEVQSAARSVSGQDDQKSKFKIPLPGLHNANNLLGAIALSKLLELTSDEIKRGLKNFKAAEGRSELHTLSGPILIICDYYNASPSSMEAAFQLLLEQSAQPPFTQGKKWACLGDMLELGRDEEAFHRALAPKLISQPIDHILLYGPRMKALLDELKKKTFKANVAHFHTHQELIHTLKKGLKPNDVVLIKGSRSMKMEIIWQELKKSIADKK